MTQDALDHKPVLQTITALGVHGINLCLALWSGQLVLHVFEQLQKISHRTHACQYVGMGAPLHQSLQARSHAIDDRREFKALLGAQCLGQCQRICGWYMP